MGVISVKTINFKNERLKKVIKMAKQLMKAIENGQYKATITGCTTSDEILGVKKTFNLFDEAEKNTFENELNLVADFYSLKLEVAGRTITVNKFCNKVIWTDANGDGWTSCDFFTSGIQRQKGLEDVTDDVEIFKNAVDIDVWISQYTNPKTGAKSYNVDSSKPKNFEVDNALGLE